MKSKTTKLFKGAYKSTFGKNNIDEKVLPSAVCTLQYHFGQLPRDHKKVCQKTIFMLFMCFVFFQQTYYVFRKYDQFYSEHTFTTLNHQRLKGFMNKSLNLF